MQFLFFYFIIYLFWFSKRGFLCVALAVCHSVDQARLELRDSVLSRIKGICHHLLTNTVVLEPTNYVL